MTTIKLPSELRDRVNDEARARGVTAATLLAQLLDEHDRRQWFAQIKNAYKQLPADDDYWAETRAWDQLASRLPVDHDGA